MLCLLQSDWLFCCLIISSQGLVYKQVRLCWLAKTYTHQNGIPYVVDLSRVVFSVIVLCVLTECKAFFRGMHFPVLWIKIIVDIDSFNNHEIKVGISVYSMLKVDSRSNENKLNQYCRIRSGLRITWYKKPNIFPDKNAV